MISPYYPEINSERADWWQNILAEGPPIFSELGLDATLQGNILRDTAWAILVYRTVPETYDHFQQTITGWCTSYLHGPNGGPGPVVPQIPAFPALPPVTCPTGIEDRRPNWVQTIKSHPNYNPLTHGITLKIEGTGTPFVPANYTGEIKRIKATGGGKVELKLDKARGNIDSNCVYGRKTGTPAFALLGKFNAATATVTIPGLSPGALEEWEFCTRGVVKDTEIGNMSLHVSTVVKG